MAYDHAKRLNELRNKLAWLNQEIATCQSRTQRKYLLERREMVNRMIHKLKGVLGYALK